mmetsp:Transcript_13243/g.25737  ORF Transcript_13243/g.25737 Transcript_13243/m.25737 type:complete len:123 (+) Transcript_13243:25-393(+)
MQEAKVTHVASARLFPWPELQNRKLRASCCHFLVSSAGYLRESILRLNVFYLPMLAMRAPREPTAEAPPLTSIQAVGESRAFAMVLGLLPLLALCWFEFGRADLGGATRPANYHNLRFPTNP